MGFKDFPSWISCTFFFYKTQTYKELGIRWQFYEIKTYFLSGYINVKSEDFKPHLTTNTTFKKFIGNEVWRASQVALLVKNLSANAGDTRDSGFSPWVGKIPWRRAWQPTPVFLPGESHEQRTLAGFSPWVCKESDTSEATEHTQTQWDLGVKVSFSEALICMSISRILWINTKNMVYFAKKILLVKQTINVMATSCMRYW